MKILREKGEYLHPGALSNKVREEWMWNNPQRIDLGITHKLHVREHSNHSLSALPTTNRLSE
jgi:hypothetical protein